MMCTEDYVELFTYSEPARKEHRTVKLDVGVFLLKNGNGEAFKEKLIQSA